jgi:hypothetical protein
VASDRYSSPSEVRPAPVGQMPVTSPRADAASLRVMRWYVTLYRNGPPLAMGTVDIAISMMGLIVVGNLPSNFWAAAGLLLVYLFASFGISGTQYFLIHNFMYEGGWKFVLTYRGALLTILWFLDQGLDGMGYTLFTTRNEEWASRVFPPLSETAPDYWIGYGVVLIVGILSEWLLAYRIRLGTMFK